MRGWKGLVMTNKRCPCHSGNSKGFSSSVSRTGDKVPKCISSCIVMSFPQEKCYHVWLHSLIHLNKSRPAGLTPGSVHSVAPVPGHFPPLSHRCLVIWRCQIALTFPNQIYSFRHSEIYFSVLNVLSSPSLSPGMPAASHLLFIYQLNVFRWQVLLPSFFNGETEAQEWTAHSLSSYIAHVLLTSIQLPAFCFCHSFHLEFSSFWPWLMEVLAFLPSPGTCHLLCETLPAKPLQHSSGLLCKPLQATTVS